MRMSYGQSGFECGARPSGARVWTVHLREPLGFPTDDVLSVQLPAGDYELSERDDIHYELRASAFSVSLRVTELNRLRGSGKLVIDGYWP
jgi:hypothetical protein